MKLSYFDIMSMCLGFAIGWLLFDVINDQQYKSIVALVCIFIAWLIGFKLKKENHETPQ